jgi:hypothetical protein
VLTLISISIFIIIALSFRYHASRGPLKEVGVKVFNAELFVMIYVTILSGVALASTVSLVEFSREGTIPRTIMEL